MLNLSKIQKLESRSISPENFGGEKGKGGMAEQGTGAEAARDLGRGWKISPSVKLEAGETFTLADIKEKGIIKHIWITDSAPQRCLVIRMYWDDSDIPSVEVPLGDFFACADFEDYRQITSLPVCVNPKRAFNCYWDMPFYKSCRITLENLHSEAVVVYYQIDYVTGDIDEGLGYFHARFNRSNPLPYMQDHVILDTIHGNGHYVGTYLFWGVNNNGWWGEGEIKFFMDGDTEYPTICGTGTEDYICGSWNFDVNGKYTEFCTPYSGLARVSTTDGIYKSNRRFSMYRWHITDPIYFKNDLKVTIQAIGWRSGHRYHPLQDDISSVAFWYQDTICRERKDFPTKDELEII